MFEWEICFLIIVSFKYFKNIILIGRKSKKVFIQLLGIYSYRYFVDADIVENVCCDFDTDVFIIEIYRMLFSEDLIISEFFIQFFSQGMGVLDKKKLLIENWDNFM